MYGEDCEAKQLVGAGRISSNRPTIMQRLTARKADLERELASVNEAIGAMERYPEMEAALNLLAKVGI